MGMEGARYDPFISTSAPGSCSLQLCEFKPLVAEADYISLHLARTPITEHLGGWSCSSPMQPTRPSGQLCRQGGIVR